MTLRKFAGLGALSPGKSLGRAFAASKAAFLPATAAGRPCSALLPGERSVSEQPERQHSMQRSSPGGGLLPRLGFAR